MSGKWRDLCNDKIVAPAEALKAIQPGSRVFIGSACGEPRELVRAMTKFGDRLEDTEVIHVLTLGVTPYAEAKYAPNFRANAFFVGNSGTGNISTAPLFDDLLPSCLDGEIGLREVDRILRRIAVLRDQVAGVAGEGDVLSFALCAGAEIDHFRDAKKMVVGAVT